MKIFALLFATAIWGLGFVGTRWTFNNYSPMWSNSLRFIFAGLIIAPILIFLPKLKTFKGPLLASIFIYLALLLQTIGLAHTTLAKSGFLTVFYAIFTPIISIFLYRQKFKTSYWALLSLAFLGILFLCELNLNNFNIGDAYTIASAFALSLHILVVDRYAKGSHPVVFNGWQSIFVGIIGLVVAYFTEGWPNLSPLLDPGNLFKPGPIWGFVVLSIFSSLIAFSLQVYAQKGTAPHVVSLSFLMESVFAALFGFLLFNETLSTMALIGCTLVVGSVLLLPRLSKN